MNDERYWWTSCVAAEDHTSIAIMRGDSTVVEYVATEDEAERRCAELNGDPILKAYRIEVRWDIEAASSKDAERIAQEEANKIGGEVTAIFDVGNDYEELELP